MSEYTPTMQQIRDSYRSHDTLQAAAAGFSWEERGEEFDRWLAAHDEQVRADERERCVEAIRNVDPRPRIGRSIWEFIPRREAIDALMAVPAEQKESN